MKDEVLLSGWASFHNYWNKGTDSNDRGDVSEGIAAFGNAMRVLVCSCENDRRIKSDEWIKALCHSLMNYCELGGVDLLFQYSKEVIANLAFFSTAELDEMDLDLAAVLKIMGAIVVRLSECGELSQAIVLGRGLNYVVSLQLDPSDIETLKICLASSIWVGGLLLCAGQVNEAESSFNNALEYSVRMEKSGQDDDPKCHLQCYALGVAVYLAKGSYEKVGFILDATRKVEIDLTKSGKVMDDSLARIFLCAEIILDRGNQRFREALRKAVLLCRDVRSADEVGAKVPAYLPALAHAEIALALFELGRDRASMIWAGSSLSLLKATDGEGWDHLGDDHLGVAYRILEVLTGLVHRGYPESLKTLNSMSGELIRLIEDLEGTRGSDRDSQLWLDKLLILRNAHILSAFDLVASADNADDSESDLKMLLCRWETQFSSKIHEFWLEPRRAEKLRSDPLPREYGRLKHRQAVRAVIIRASSRLNPTPDDTLKEKPALRDVRIRTAKPRGNHPPVRDSLSSSIDAAPLDHQINELLDEIRKLDPSFGMTNEFGAIDLERVRASLMTDECVVVPVYSVKNAHLIVICGVQVKIFSMGEDNYKNLLSYLIRYYELVDFSANLVERAEGGPCREFDDIAQVAEEIIRPINSCFIDVLTEVMAYLGAEKRRVFLLHDANLPCFAYHAIPVHGNQLFGDEVDVSYVPNLRVLELIDRNGAGSMEDVVVSSEIDKNLKLCAIEKKLVWKDSARIIRKGLSRSEVMNRIEKVNVFHFCGHVEVNLEMPLMSSILIADDHLLTIEDVCNGIRLRNCQLVILNGCGSGIYRRALPPSWRRIDNAFYGVENEPISFSTAFLVAGAKSTLTTLWPVWDLAACVFMWKFSSLVESGMETCAALKRTTQWMRSDISDGEYLIRQVLPDMLGKVKSWKDRWRLSKRLKEHAQRHEHSPPFGHHSYWAGYILSGVPW